MDKETLKRILTNPPFEIQQMRDEEAHAPLTREQQEKECLKRIRRLKR